MSEKVIIQENSKKVVRHHKVIRDSIQGITKPGIARICQRGGVLRIGGTVYEEFRGCMKVFGEDLMKDVIAITQHARRKTVKASDLEAALQIKGLYLGAAENPNTSKTFSTVKSRPKTASKKEEGTVTKPHKFKPGTVARREIRHQQKHSDDFALPKANFNRFVREIGQDYATELRYTAKFLELAQLVVETHLTDLMVSANLCALHAGRQTILPKDLQLARKLRTIV